MPVAILPTPRGPSAFLYRDPEGAPDSRGIRHHAAQDWFAPGGTPVACPVEGRVVEVKYSGGDDRGQVYGGTVKVQATGAAPWVYVCRHTEPEPGIIPGRAVHPGDTLARVTRWADRPSASHVHLEVWRTLDGGYQLLNMIDPGLLTWLAEVPRRVPRPSGAGLRLVLPGHPVFAGWEDGGQGRKGALGPLRWIAAHGLDEGLPCLLTWQRRKFTGAREVQGVARNFAARGFLA